jgi:hypothetical protein
MMGRLFFSLQKVLLHASFAATRLTGRRRPITWVVGPQEIASMAHRLAALIPGSHTAVIVDNPYFAFRYESRIPAIRSPLLRDLARGILGPIILGRLVARARGFLYLGELGFLPNARDSRAYEFEFLTRRGCVLVCYFVGSDIRSPARMRELEKATGLQNLGTHLGRVDPVFDTPEYDAERRRLAEVAETFAHAVFSATVDQASYLQRPTHPITYFFPDDEFLADRGKFTDLSRPVIVHAPTSPQIKGTEHVRSAIERLESEGYRFEYVELIGVPNTVVRSELRRAHIALNQFYAYIPGVFGIEALASLCAVLMSADETIEPDLPRGSNTAWLVTRYDNIYEQLKSLLDHPESIEPLAVRGQDWARKHVGFASAGPRLREILDSVLPPDGQVSGEPAEPGSNPQDLMSG